MYMLVHPHLANGAKHHFFINLYIKKKKRKKISGLRMAQMIYKKKRGGTLFAIMRSSFLIQFSFFKAKLSNPLI